MADDEKYLTAGGVLSAVGAAFMTRLTCLRRGHDVVLVTGERLCRRCYGTLR